MYRILFGLCICVVSVSCDYNGTYQGLLTPECVASYHRIFITKKVPPRTYQYFHEVQHSSIDDPYGDADFRFRIVGGSQTTIEQVPYAVLYGLYCGAVLLAPEWVLTAAHCKTKEKYVHAGSTQRSQTIRYNICAHFIHPKWDPNDVTNHDYDYQLVLLETPIPVTSRSRPVVIGHANDIRVGEMVSVCGWGHIRHKEKMQDIIRRVFLPIMDANMCRSLPNKEYHHISERMFCAGYIEGSKDSCQGDSGGPAVVNGKLVGIVSFGVGCAETNQPGVYANVPLAREWIRQITGLPL